MTTEQLQTYINKISGKEAAQIAEIITNLAATAESGSVKHLNEALYGPDVKDDIVRLAILLKTYFDKVKATADVALLLPHLLANDNSLDILLALAPQNDVYEGVTYVRNNDGTIHVTGTAANISVFSFYYEQDSLPDWLKPGKTYNVVFNRRSNGSAVVDPNNNIRFNIVCYDGNGDKINGSDGVFFTENGAYTIPSETAGIWLRLYVKAGTSNINEIVTAKLLTALTNTEISDILYGGSDHDNKEPRVLNRYIPSGNDLPLDVRDMPRDSFIYKAASAIQSLPDGISNSDTIFVRRLPLIAYDHVSLYVCYDVNAGRWFYSYYQNTSGTQEKSPIVWTEVPAHLDQTMYNYGHSNFEAGKSADLFTTNGIYTSSTDTVDGQYVKTIAGFPFVSGWLVVLNWARTSLQTTVQIAISNDSGRIGTDNETSTLPKIRYKNTNGVWGGWRNIGDFVSGISDKINSDFVNDDWLMTEYEETAGWWKNDGTLGATETALTHSQLIPVYPGQKLYAMYFGGQPFQHSGGAFFDEQKRWLDVVGYPFTNPTTEVFTPGKNVAKFNYISPDNWPGGTGLVYADLWEITVPSHAAYISINLANHTSSDAYHLVQSLSTLPMIGSSNTGNRIWRRGDPSRAIKKGKTLYVIGPSTVSIDRAFRSVYDAATGETSSNMQPIVGFQEYFIPYYDKVVSLGFNGKSYSSIYSHIEDGSYEHSDILPLSEADEVLIVPNGNNDDGAEPIGNATDTTPTSYCGAINSIIQHIIASSSKPVRIFLAGRQNQWPEGSERYTDAHLRNERLREIAELHNFTFIEAEKIGVRVSNYRYLSYDSNRSLYSPYGGHPNNEGNRILGNIYLSGLLGQRQ